MFEIWCESEYEGAWAFEDNYEDLSEAVEAAKLLAERYPSYIVRVFTTHWSSDDDRV